MMCGRQHPKTNVLRNTVRQEFTPNITARKNRLIDRRPLRLREALLILRQSIRLTLLCVFCDAVSVV